MIIGTTPHHTFKVPFKFDESPQAIQITYRQYGEIVLQRQLDTIEIEEVEDGSTLTIHLTQEETFKFRHGIALVFIRIVTADGEAHGSDF